MSAAIETALFANVIFLYKCTNGEMTSEFANAKKIHFSITPKFWVVPFASLLLCSAGSFGSVLKFGFFSNGSNFQTKRDRSIIKPFLESLGFNFIYYKKTNIWGCFWTVLIPFSKSMLSPNPAKVYFKYYFLCLTFALFNTILDFF